MILPKLRLYFRNTGKCCIKSKTAFHDWRPLLCGSLIVVFLLIYLMAGQINEVDIYFDEPNDTFEELNYRGEGRISAPYIVWHQKDENRTSKSLIGHIKIRYRWPALYWGKQFGEEAKLTLNYKDGSHGSKSDIAPFLSSLTLNLPAIGAFPKDREANMSIFARQHTRSDTSFKISFNRGEDRRIEAPRLTSFTLICSISSQRLLFFRTRASKHKKYRVFLGPDLGRVWLAIDPGTTATCMATATHSEQMFLSPRVRGQDSEEREGIIPSVLAINKTQNYIKPPKITEFAMTGDVKIGYDAKQFQTSSKHICFQSIKKILGYKDKYKLEFSNGIEMEVDGKNLTTLLVTGMTNTSPKGSL
jgi:hypothetical protein